MTTVRIINLSLQLWGSVLCIALMICVYSANQARRKSDKLYLLLLLTDMMSMLCDAGALYFRGRMTGLSWFFVRLMNFGSFTANCFLGYVFALFLANYIEQKRMQKPHRIYTDLCTLALAVNELLLIFNLLQPFMYEIDAQNIYHRLPRYPIIFISMLAAYLSGLCMILKYHRDLEKWERIFFCVMILIPFGATIATTLTYGIVYAQAGATTCLILMFVYLQSENGRLQAEQENELLKNQIAMMMGQIQPHFLFNALNTIEFLCEERDPRRAEVVNHFSRFLRDNMDSVFIDDAVPFEKELEHLKNYLYIDLLRFPHVKIEYDLETEDFALPSLTLQPLVENAIKHGVRYKKKDAQVLIKTWEAADSYFMCVKDNGKGFSSTDPEYFSRKTEDGRSHVGLLNTIRRVEMMCGGTVSIESTPEVETRITVRIPKEKQEKKAGSQWVRAFLRT